MSIRWIIHKKDGRTITSDWNSNIISFRESWSKDITSLQLQREYDKKLYTLSIGKDFNTLFWQTDDFILEPNTMKSKMISRRIFKSLGNNNWLEVGLLLDSGKPTINIINKIIRIP